MTVFLGRLAMLAVVLFSAVSAYAGDGLMVLNSDGSIEKYRMTQQVFLKEFDHPVRTLDLGRGGITDADFENIYLDESPKVIYCIGYRAYALAHSIVDSSTKLVFSSIINWHRLRIPDNVYGVSNELYPGMQLMMFRYFFPELKTIGLLYSQSNKGWLEATEKEAKQVNISIVAREITRPSQVHDALTEVLPQVEAMWLISDPLVLNSMQAASTFFEQSRNANKPVFSYDRAFRQFDPFLIVESDLATMARQAAGLCQTLLAGRAPAQHVKRVAGSYNAIDLKGVKEYGILFNPDALDSVNSVGQ